MRSVTSWVSEKGISVTDQWLRDLDDSFINCEAAHKRGWKVAHLLDPADSAPPSQAAKHQIRSLEELRDIFPEVFKSTNGALTS
jgi:pyrimidine and pyridine-specific 5'-nucleotidase